MTKRPFVLVDSVARQRAIECVREAPQGYCVVVSEPTRSLEQNAKLHTMFSALKAQHSYLGRRLTAGQWKVLMISGHAIATGQGADILPGLEGEFVNVRESSATMSVARMNSLIEYIAAYGAQHGVDFDAR